MSRIAEHFFPWQYGCPEEPVRNLAEEEEEPTPNGDEDVCVFLGCGCPIQVCLSKDDDGYAIIGRDD